MLLHMVGAIDEIFSTVESLEEAGSVGVGLRPNPAFTHVSPFGNDQVVYAHHQHPVVAVDPSGFMQLTKPGDTDGSRQLTKGFGED